MVHVRILLNTARLEATKYSGPGDYRSYTSSRIFLWTSQYLMKKSVFPQIAVAMTVLTSDVKSLETKIGRKTIVCPCSGSMLV